MRRMNGGLYIGPWTLRIMIAVPLLGLIALFVFQLPDLKRYMKFESM
jgi:hypothetical protein